MNEFSKNEKQLYVYGCVYMYTYVCIYIYIYMYKIIYHRVKKIHSIK